MNQSLNTSSPSRLKYNFLIASVLRVRYRATLKMSINCYHKFIGNARI